MTLLRSLAICLAAGLVSAAGLLADPEPPRAQATSLPCVAVSPAGAVGDVFGIGNPVGDACEAVTDPILGAAGDKILGPLKDAANALGKGVFNQVTAWVADGAVWLVGEIAVGIDKSTSPNLLSKGFLHQYRLMAQIAALMAALMLTFVVLEAVGRGEPSLLWRVFLVNVPLAAIATSVAYVVVQLLLATSDGMGEAVAQTTDADTRAFFKGTLESLAALGAEPGALAGATVGGPGLGAAPGGQAVGEAAGAVAVPLFVGFIAAAVMAIAALLVWIELLMRDAAVYVVALFMPLSFAAAIWPRWGSALRRTCELLIVVIFSKFVIVSIISLAASMVARGDGSVEQVLAAAAMLLIACFSPFVLFKLVPFAEGAMSAAYHRQSAGGGALRTLQTASSVQMMRRAAMANWSTGGGGGSSGAGPGGGGGGAAGGRGRGKPPLGGGRPTGNPGGATGAAAAAVGAASMPAAAGAGAAKAAKGGSQKLANTGVAAAAGSSSGGSEASQSTSPSQGAAGVSRPRPQGEIGADSAAAPTGEGDTTPPSTGGPARRSPGIPVEPSEPQGGAAAIAGGRPPRPGGSDALADPTKGGGSR